MDVKPGKRVDLKLIASTVGGLSAGTLIAILEALVSQPALLAGLTDWARFLVIAMAPGLIVFLSGFVAPTGPQKKPGGRRRCECSPAGESLPDER